MSKFTNALLLFLFASVGVSVGQNIDKNVDSYTYTRMPSHPFPSSVTSYYITDDLYTGPTESGYEIAKKIKAAIQIPRLTESSEHKGANFLVRVEGFSRTELEMNEITRKEKRGDEEISVTYYYYSFGYKYPVYYEVTLPNEAEPIDKAYLTKSTYDTHRSPSYKSQGQVYKWWSENKNTVAATLRKKLLQTGIENLKHRVDSRFAFTVVKERALFYTVKKFKKFDYTDVDAAYETAQAAVATIEPTDKIFSGEFSDKMQLAINQWEKIIAEKDLEKRKTRINKKVTERMYRNIFQALVMMDRFDEAHALKDEAESLIKNAITATMEQNLENKENRYNANIEELELKIAEN